MARPRGTTKPDSEKRVPHAFRFPPALWQRFVRLVPKGRTKFLLNALTRALDELEAAP